MAGNLRATLFLASLSVVGCAGGPRMALLEADLRRLRDEHERQSAELENLRHRVVLTEDAAREARSALVNTRRETIRIAEAPAAAEPIRVDATVRPGAPEGPASDDPRPAVRMVRNERIPESPTPLSRESDRISVVPVPPAPTTAPPPSGSPSSGHGSRSSQPPPSRPSSSTPPSSDARPRSGDVPRAELQGHGFLDPRAAEAYDAAVGLVRGRDWERGAEAMSSFLVRWPDHPHADNAMYWRAECFMQTGDTARGIAELEGLVARFPVGNKAPDALLKLAVTYRRSGDAASAERAARRLITDYPDSDAARRLQDERLER